MKFRKTRIAPTPSGYLHLGNVLSFAVTAEIARRSGAAILLRIDDLDRERMQPEYVQDIFDTLNFMEIPWDEGPGDYQEFVRQYSQLHRMELYTKTLRELRETGALFACECSRTIINQTSPDGLYPGTCRGKHIPFDREDVSWRLLTEMDRQIEIRSLTIGEPGNPDNPEIKGRLQNITGRLQDITASLPGSLKDFIVRKKDGYPAYQLASVVDDRYFGIDLVIRGTDLQPSTIAQLYLSGLLKDRSFERAVFFHHGLLKAANGEKLSKSAGAQSIQYLRTEGRNRAEIYSLLAKMLGSDKSVSDYKGLAEIALS